MGRRRGWEERKSLGVLCEEEEEEEKLLPLSQANMLLSRAKVKPFSVV
jgi:hypothetical protein